MSIDASPEDLGNFHLREHREWSLVLRKHFKPWRPPPGLTRYLWRNLHGHKRTPTPSKIPTRHALWTLVYLGRRARWLRANGRRYDRYDRKTVGALLDILGARDIKPNAEDCFVYWDKLNSIGRQVEGAQPLTLLEVWALGCLAKGNA